MLVDGGHFDAEQLGDGLLGEPDGFALEKHLHFHRAVLAGVEQKFAGLVHATPPGAVLDSLKLMFR